MAYSHVTNFENQKKIDWLLKIFVVIFTPDIIGLIVQNTCFNFSSGFVNSVCVCVCVCVYVCVSVCVCVCVCGGGGGAGGCSADAQR